jgi:hypothetical protein
MHKNLAAFTPPGLDPPYVSINREDGGSVTIHVRAVKEFGGHTSCITLTREQFNALLLELNTRRQ